MYSKCTYSHKKKARLAQSVARETLNLKVVGSSPTSGFPFALQPSFCLTMRAIGQIVVEISRLQIFAGGEGPTRASGR